jgi:hypothetical protein
VSVATGLIERVVATNVIWHALSVLWKYIFAMGAVVVTLFFLSRKEFLP